MSERSVQEPVSFKEKLAGSQAFSALFKDGMGLVEETAAYLDGPGRKESKALKRTAALTYATESMRLTTRLMQLASWLLLHRAVKEGEMSLAQVNQEKTKVKISGGEAPSEETLLILPETLVDLIARSRKLAGTGDAARCQHSRVRSRAGSRQQGQSGRETDGAAQGGLRTRRRRPLLTFGLETN